MEKKLSTNKQNNILLLGFGYVAQYFSNFTDLENSNLCASINKTLSTHIPISKNISKISYTEITQATLDQYDVFIISIPPIYALKTDVIIQGFYSYLNNRTTKYKLIYLSATSVYGDHDNQLVNENSTLKSNSVNGLARIECEKKYLALQSNNFANIIILRLAAIYGPKRNNILAIKNQRILSNQNSNRIISRTHVIDIAHILNLCVKSANIKNQIFNICDNLSCSTKEVNDFICGELLKINLLPLSDKENSNKLFSYHMERKIVSNNKLKEQLNYKFIYPNYKLGITEIFHNLTKELSE